MAAVVPVIVPLIPAILVARQKRIVRLFQAAGADAPARARTPAELDIRDKHLFGRLVRAGVLAAADEGRFFVSAEGLARWHQRRWFALKIVLTVFLALGAIAAIVLATR